MTNAHSRLSALDILRTGPVVPVIVLNNADHAVPLAQALLAGGIRVLEITLRSTAALSSISRISKAMPEAIVGAGTVLTAADLEAAAAVGGRFAISPGLTPALLAAAKNAPIPLIPGVATASELMLAMEQGFTALKFFPAEAAGGVQTLKSWSGPFPKISFCPTGGISEKNYLNYLNCANVVCVGGSWLAPPELIDQEDWEGIAALARKVAAHSPHD